MTTSDRQTALCTIVHRAAKMNSMYAAVEIDDNYCDFKDS